MRQLFAVAALAIGLHAHAADVAISALPAASTPVAGTESVPIVQGGITKKAAITSLTSGIAITPSSVTSTTGTFTTTVAVTATLTNINGTPTMSASGLTFSSGTWTPVDASGAALSLTGASGTYWLIGKMVFITAEFVYPATADVTTAVIGGLPSAAAATSYALVTNKGMTGAGTFAAPTVIASTTTIKFSASNNKDVFHSNVNVSASSWRISGFYLVP